MIFYGKQFWLGGFNAVLYFGQLIFLVTFLKSENYVLSNMWY